MSAFCGGPERIRTADLCNANAALYQLSYRPVLAYPMDCAGAGFAHPALSSIGRSLRLAMLGGPKT